MRLLLLTFGILASTAGVGNAVPAVNYPWCAYYSGSRGGGGTNCGFSTFDQCMATVSGIGGFCMVNTQYEPPVAHPGVRKHSYHNPY